MAILSVSDQDFEQKVLKSEKAALVDFWAPWCGPCRLAEPVLEELSSEHSSDVDFYKMNVDENQTFPEKYGVMSIPTTILFKGGQEVGRQVGFAGKKAFEEVLQKAK